MSSRTKGRNKAFKRRQLRKKEKRNYFTRGKMLGRLCKYDWGGGKTNEERDLSETS